VVALYYFVVELNNKKKEYRRIYQFEYPKMKLPEIEPCDV
jgi:hypothetical protein